MERGRGRPRMLVGVLVVLGVRGWARCGVGRFYLYVPPPPKDPPPV